MFEVVDYTFWCLSGGVFPNMVEETCKVSELTEL